MRFANAISSIYIIFPFKFDLSHGRVFAMGHEIFLCSHNPFRPSLRTIGKCNTLASRYIALGLRYVCPIKRGSALTRSWKAERRGGSGAERRREVERSDPDFSISGKDARSPDRDKHRGHNKVWINERGISLRRWSPKVSSRVHEFSLFVRQYELLNTGLAVTALSKCQQSKIVRRNLNFWR